MTHEQWQALERSIVLHLLDNDHPEPWTVGELEAQLDPETLAVRHALGELGDYGVAEVEAQTTERRRAPVTWTPWG